MGGRRLRIESVPVPGGACAVARSAGDGPTLLLVHGITASHRSWQAVVDRLRTPATILAPDLRGRGGSAALPGPFGFAAHARDLLAILDHYGVSQAVAVGHSMGAYVALELARTAPDRVGGVVLVDGGLALPVPPGVDPDLLLKAVLGPAMARLGMTFPSREAYHDYWRAHPALQDRGAWSPYLEAYLDYDLTGEPPALKSVVNPEAVAEDGRGPLAPETATLVDGVQQRMLLLTAERGLLNQPEPLLPKALVQSKCERLGNLEWREIPDTNHYTITLGSGAQAVAEAIDRFAATAE